MSKEYVVCFQYIVCFLNAYNCYFKCLDFHNLETPMVLQVSPLVLLLCTIEPALFFRIWHSFEFALSMIAEIRQYEHSICNIGLSWCFQIQCRYLLYTFNAIVIGLQQVYKSKYEYEFCKVHSIFVLGILVQIGCSAPRFCSHA